MNQAAVASIMKDPVRVTLWNEFLHERENETVRRLYPNGIHNELANGISAIGSFECRGATLDQPEHGLSQEILDQTDTLVWWGHKAHHLVSDEVVERVHQEVLRGMGLVVLHSGHFSKIFRRLMGTNCSLKWREADERERLWNLVPDHPIMEGIPDYFEIEPEEMYGEPFDVPAPDELLMISWFQGGEVFRSACTWRRGNGRVFYFRPGHETYTTYKHELALRVIANGCRWVARRITRDTQDAPNARALEPVPNQDKTSALL
jgi:trehalose utilization protein